MPAPRFTPSLTIKLDDDQAERVHRNIEQRLLEIQASPALSSMTLANVVLADNAETVVPHGLGRIPTVLVSPPMGAASGGVIRDFGSKSPLTGVINDRTKSILLRCDGFGAAITVNIVVM